MGLEEIENRANIQEILPAHLNLIKKVISKNFVPRNINGVVEDQSGNLGSILYSFLHLYLLACNFGDSDSVKKIYESSNDLILRLTESVNYLLRSQGLNYKISESCGNYTGSGGGIGLQSYITNLEVTITTSGRPVFLGLIDDSNITNKSYMVSNSASGNPLLVFYRGTTRLNYTLLSSDITSKLPVTCLRYVDPVAAGTYTYKLAIQDNDLALNYAKLIAYEL